MAATQAMKQPATQTTERPVQQKSDTPLIDAASRRWDQFSSTAYKLEGFLKKAVPHGFNSEYLLRSGIATVKQTPDLLECSDGSICACILKAAQLGLQFGGALGQCYMVPFKGEATLMIGYKGLIALAGRNPRIAIPIAHVVYKGDDFDYEYGTRPYVKHKPHKKTDEPLFVYASVTYTHTDLPSINVMSWQEIIEFRGKYVRATQRSPWFDGVKDPWQPTHGMKEMARKTPLRNVFKYVPLATDLQEAASLDEYGEMGIPQGLTLPEGIVPPPKTQTENVKAKLVEPAEQMDEAGPIPPANMADWQSDANPAR